MVCETHGIHHALHKQTNVMNVFAYHFPSLFFSLRSALVGNNATGKLCQFFRDVSQSASKFI